MKYSAITFGNERIYNQAFTDRNDVVLWDVFPIVNEQYLKISFEEKNSDWAQGIWLMCDLNIETAGKISKSINLWYETAPLVVYIKCYTKNNLLSVYNIWDRGLGRKSQSHSSGMLVTEIPNGRHFKCNDIGFNTNFDKLIFRIEKVEDQS